MILARKPQGQPADTTGPGAVADLVASESGAQTPAHLSWTAAGDDGASGTATNYEVRYAAAAINDETKWAAATLATAAWAANAVAGGQAASLDIPHATLGAGTHYFAVRYRDEAGNVGAISNSPAVTLYATPIVRATLYATGTATRIVVEDFPTVTDASAQTAAQTHDGSDAVMDTVSVWNEEEGASGSLRVEWGLTTTSYAGVISSIKIYTRGIRDVGMTATLTPSINGTTRGTARTLGTSLASYSEALTTDPADSAAWTAAKLAAQKIGYILAASGMPGGAANASEFKVEVLG